MMEWYVVREGKPEGPYSDFQFHRLAEVGAITPTNLVWYTGRKELIPAGEIHNLFAATPSPADQYLSHIAPPSRRLPVWLADYIPSAKPLSDDSHALPVRKTSYLRRHWSGGLSLELTLQELTFWVNGVIFFFALYTLPVVAPHDPSTNHNGAKERRGMESCFPSDNGCLKISTSGTQTKGVRP